jgi:hypothetical protein
MSLALSDVDPKVDVCISNSQECLYNSQEYLIAAKSACSAAAENKLRGLNWIWSSYHAS